MIEHPLIERVNRIGYPSKIEIKHPETFMDTSCEICGQWEAVVKFKGVKFCPLCAKEERIEVI